jgi:hypothetical protein
MMTALVFLSVLSMLVLGMLGASVDTSRLTTRQADEVSTQSSAESVMALAINRIWGDFLRQTSGQEVRIWDFQTYLDGKGIPNLAGKAGSDGTDMMPKLTMADGKKGLTLMGDVVVEELTIRREDDFNSTMLILEVNVASQRGANSDRNNRVVTQTVSATWKVEAADWEGLEYAMLANNVNCILCHTEVDNAQRVFNGDPAKYGTFDRVKLGSLENFVIREDPNTNVAGTIYMGGEARGTSGTPLGNWGALTLKSKKFDDGGKLLEDSWGDTLAANLSPADTLDPQPFENLYLDYLEESGGPVDGYMPSSFPSPFADDGGYDFTTGKPNPDAAGNRVVDDTEFASATRQARGSLSGGTISVIPPGERVTGKSDLKAMQAGNTDSLGGAVEGNVYLHGTKDDPIIINGPLAVDGDLFISGYVKGKGTLNVRNNVYVLDSVKYLDNEAGGQRSFGFAADGTENALAIASGGNVSVGDVFRPAWGTGSPVTGSTNGGFSFIMEEMAVFNRMEWMKTQATLPGKSAKVKTGTKTTTKTVQPKKKVKYQVDQKTYKWVKTGETKKVAVYEWVWVTTGSGPYATKKKVKQFVKWKTVDVKEKVFTGYKKVWKSKWVNDGPPYDVSHEDDVYAWKTPQVDNPHYNGSDYTPRYYSFNKGGKVPIFNKGGYFDAATKSWKSDTIIAGGWSTKKLTVANPSNHHDKSLYNKDGSSKAVISYITSTDGWMNDTMLKKLIQDGLAERDPGAVEIDATLYSNNSIFGIIPDLESPTTNGKLILNGGLVAADIGLLAPNGTTINYDSRGKDLIDVNDDSRLQITRLLWAPAN